jgi:isoleucyl-tRNA synthetase
VKDAITLFEDVVKRRVNTEEIRFEDREAPSKANPWFKAIGSDHQENTQDVARIVRDNAERLRDADGDIAIDTYTIKPDYYDLEYVQPKDGAMREGDGFHVFLDEDHAASLNRRGLMREVLRRVQTRRKDEGLDKAQRIRLAVDADETVKQAIKESEQRFTDQAGIDELAFESCDGEPFNIKDHTVRLAILDVRG